MNLVHSTLIKVKNIILPQGPVMRKIIAGPCRGGIMEIDFKYQFRQYFGLYEAPLNKHFKRLIKPGHKCFDVGGKGGYNAIMAGILSQSQVVTFECDQQAVSELNQLASINNLPITVVNTFIGDHNSNTHKTLDWAAQNYFYPDFIKIDIEGFEVEALKGAVKILSTKRPALIIETHSQELENECINILKAHNYQKIEIINQTTLFPEKRDCFTHNRWLVASEN